MKTVKTIFVAIALMISMAAMANDLEVISGMDGNVTITESSNTVSISILNSESVTYKLYIFHSTTGDLVYEGYLGNEKSIGKSFDFENSVKGNYTFKLVASNGEKANYKIKTGSEF